MIPVVEHGIIKHTKIDKEDAGLVLKHTWSVSRGYVVTNTKPAIRMHRLVLNAPNGLQIDHINHDTFDNRKGNLRLATQGQNNMNAIKRKGTNKYRGVYRRSQNSFRAKIHANGKSYTAGPYKTEEEGAIGYNQLARKLHGEFAVLNEIPEIKK